MENSDFVIKSNQTILSALLKLNKQRDTSRLILFVESNQGKIIGSLTDGDIRRALIKHEDLNMAIEQVCFKDFVYEYEQENFIQLDHFRKKNINILPLLREDKTLSRLIDLKKSKSIIPIECMIMAGGRGKRLSPLTDKIPKPMLPLNGKPIIEYNIDRLISYGIKKIYISVKYLGEQIQDYFGDGSSKGIEIEYVWEDNALGTAGALSLVNEFKSDHILLLNSDLFTNVNIEEMYLKLVNNNADLVVASTEYKIDVPYAVFECDSKKVRSLKEKPSYTYYSNAGVYLFKKEIIYKIPNKSFFDITDLMDLLIKEEKEIIHFPIRGYWIDIGNPTDYKNAEEFVKSIKVEN